MVMCILNHKKYNITIINRNPYSEYIHQLTYNTSTNIRYAN
jgi:hypothetical protein